MRRRDFLSLGIKAGLVSWLGCRLDDGLLLPALHGADEPPADGTLLARFAHVTDTHVLDEESPARLPGTRPLTKTSWRSHEAYSTQLLDGILRAVNRMHASGRTIDFLLHTGDATDNVQRNELDWFLTLTAGGPVEPLSGADDRFPDGRPPVHLDPHAPFTAQGLYRHGVHGDRPTIPWYGLPGNHDIYALGVFPIFEDADGARVSPLPLDGRAGLLLPVLLDPTADMAHGPVTPARPGPPPLLHVAEPIVPNVARAYFSRDEFIAALRNAGGTPPSRCAHTKHAPAAGDFTTQPAAGLRLVALDTTRSATRIPGGFYFDGALRRHQLDWLDAMLADADARDEIAVVATHHPSTSLSLVAGTEVLGAELRDRLRAHPSVALHLCGHYHRHRVTARDGYLEVETASTLDWPQESRIIELWRDETTGGIRIRYEVFSHINPASAGDDGAGPLSGDTPCLATSGDDPLAELRAQAATIARDDKFAAWRQLQRDPSGADPAGRAIDRAHEWTLRR